ncbi:unnamed protein product [Kuraishia capsulata CBS 1993]|uniref:Spindle pole body component Bbp1 C-terminal domain-containing protein n=1 Tax=Kuraishia capsulata CBS 1993 TaxID=1382522 RepID=W6MUX2_9ASCO|nr:uncharacterized protein KUCA_T00005605001 [Kuraishia capsulata CBS 1993]CDK29612.1 unnamed protein product [Kuraishia capsulata CBS 1993]
MAFLKVRTTINVRNTTVLVYTRSLLSYYETDTTYLQRVSSVYSSVSTLQAATASFTFSFQAPAMSWYRDRDVDSETDNTFLSYKPSSFAQPTPTANKTGLFGKVYQIIFGTEPTGQLRTSSDEIQGTSYNVKQKKSDGLDDSVYRPYRSNRSSLEDRFPYEDKVEDTLERIRFHYNSSNPFYAADSMPVPGRFPKIESPKPKEATLVKCDPAVLQELKLKLQDQRYELENIVHRVELDRKADKENRDFRQKYFDLRKVHMGHVEESKRISKAYEELADKYYDLKYKFNKSQEQTGSKKHTEEMEARLRRLQERNDELELDILRRPTGAATDLALEKENRLLQSQTDELKLELRYRDRTLRDKEEEIELLKQKLKEAHTQRPSLINNGLGNGQQRPIKRFTSLSKPEKENRASDNTTDLLNLYKDSSLTRNLKSYRV